MQMLRASLSETNYNIICHYSTYLRKKRRKACVIVTCDDFRGEMADSRDKLPPCDGRSQVTVAMVNRYLKTTGIEEVFRDLTHKLLTSPRLPYNPYPSLVRQLRAYSERLVTCLVTCSSRDNMVCKLLLYV